MERLTDAGGGEGGADGGQHRGQLLEVVGLLGELGGDHHLVAGGGRLGVVALHGPAVATHEPAVRVGGVDRRLGVGGLITPSGADVGSRPLATGPGRGGQLGHPLLVALLAGGSLGFQLGLGLLQPGQPLGPASQCSRHRIATGALAVLGLVDGSCLLEQLGYLGLERGMGAVGRRGGVGLDLGAIQGDQAQADHAGRRAQLQREERIPVQ
jgi:hypothetical protein